MISIHALLAESDYRLPGTTPWACYFYPRSPCGERRNIGSAVMVPPTISIHALLAESDFDDLKVPETVSKISIHALLAESDSRGSVSMPRYRNFYPRSPCGERPAFQKLMAALLQFLSTLSLRRATPRDCPVWSLRPYFYPRSPCGERQQKCRDRKTDVNFYPRSPCGERPQCLTFASGI